MEVTQLIESIVEIVNGCIDKNEFSLRRDLLDYTSGKSTVCPTGKELCFLYKMKSMLSGLSCDSVSSSDVLRSQVVRLIFDTSEQIKYCSDISNIPVKDALSWLCKCGNNCEDLLEKSELQSLWENSISVCPICIQDYMDDECITLWKCGHHFHTRCIKMHVFRNATPDVSVEIDEILDANLAASYDRSECSDFARASIMNALDAKLSTIVVCPLCRCCANAPTPERIRKLKRKRLSE